TLADPTSTNETLTNAFEKKVIGFDRGYITYAPRAHRWLSLTGGKFAYTWTRTPVTLDSDLNPEGFSERFNFNVNHNLVKNFNFTAMQLLINENSNQTFGVTNGADAYAVGGQVGTRLQIGKRWSMTPTYALINWRNVSQLGQPLLNAGPFGTT